MRDFIKAMSIGVLLITIMIVVTYMYNGRFLTTNFKSKYQIKMAFVLFRNFGKKAFVKFNLVEYGKEYTGDVNPHYLFQKYNYPIYRGDTILVADFGNEKFQIIYQKSWVKKYNIKVSPELIKYIPLD